MFEYQFTLADCLEGMKDIPSDSVDVVVTSPPYNLGIAYSQYDDTESREAYLKWSEKWVTEVKRVIKSDGSLFLNLGATPSNPMLPHELIIRLRTILCLQNTIHWIKSITVEKDGEQISAGHFKPINSHRFLNDCHEYIFHLTKTRNVPIDRLSVGVSYADKSNIDRWGHTNGRDKRCRGNNWFIPYKTILSRANDRPHPATFPSELAEMCIQLHGVTPLMMVMDPFLGIGNSALAAQKCGVSRFIGFDIDEQYLSVARRQTAENRTECVETERRVKTENSPGLLAEGRLF